MSQIKTMASLFTGAGIYDYGAWQAGIKLLWGVELDPDPIRLHKLNLPSDCRVFNDNVGHFNYSGLPIPDLLHASPSCRTYSQANYGYKDRETKNDISSAQGVVKALEALRPEFFTLENVYRYECSTAFEMIYDCLNRLGYCTEVYKIDLANYGVPQSRKRMIVLATRGSTILELPPTKMIQGWSNAIADLMPGFSTCELTNTQKKILRKNSLDGYIYRDRELPKILIKRNQIKDSLSLCKFYEPAFTVTATLATDHKKSNRSLFANVVDRSGCYSVTVRALARFQTIPDEYKLLNEIATDCLGIGNGVPPLFVKNLLSRYV